MKEFEYYAGKHLEYPVNEYPKPMKLRPGSDSDAYLEYANKLKAYEDNYHKFKERLAKWQNEANSLEQEFKKDIFEKHGVTGNPKAERCYSLAYEHGHSSGYSDIYYYFSDFVELIK